MLLSSSVLGTLLCVSCAAQIPWLLTALCWPRKDSCQRASALKSDKFPMAWAEEEPLRALVITRTAGASQNQGETHTHTHLQVRLAAGGHLPHRLQTSPSPCYLLQRILAVITNTDFIIFEVRIKSKNWGLDIKKYCCLDCLNKGSVAYFWHTTKLAGES